MINQAESVVRFSNEARRIAVAATFAAAMTAAGIASAQTRPTAVATMSAAQARQIAIAG